MENATELMQIVQSAQQGYWIPLGVVATAWSVIIGLLLYIYNRNQKESEKRHSEHTQILQKLTDNQQSLQILVAEIKTKQEMTITQK
jgi:hypothetical protein